MMASDDGPRPADPEIMTAPSSSSPSSSSACSSSSARIPSPAGIIDPLDAVVGRRAVVELERKLVDYDSDMSDTDDDEALILSTVEHTIDRGDLTLTLRLKEDVFGMLASSVVDSPLSCWSGGHVWTSAHVLADYLNRKTIRKMICNTSLPDRRAQVLELGSGCGLLGLAAMVLGGKVTLTDQTMQLPLLRMNAKYNHRRLERAEIERHGESTCPCPQVKELIWGQAPSPPDKSLKGYDLVLGSDLFYIPGQAVNFTATLLSIFHTARALGQQNPPLVLLAHGTRADSFHNSFFEEFEKASLTINTVSTVEHDKEQDMRNVTSIYEISFPLYDTCLSEVL